MYDAHSSPSLDPRAGLSVRPDVLWIPVAARVEGAAPADAVAALQALASTLTTRILTVHPGATLQPGRLTLGHTTGKSDPKSDQARLDGRLVVPLDLDADFWQRARLAASAHEVLGAVAKDPKKRGPRLTLEWASGSPRLADADALFPVLAAVWKSRVAMLDESRGGSAWDAPVEIEQHSISLEEVKLTLVDRKRGTR